MSNTSRAIPRYLLQVSILVLSLAAALFVSSGRLDWGMGWVFLAMFAATHLGIALVLVTSNPELMAERADLKGKRDLDRILASIIALYGPAGMCIVAGLDFRFGWLPHIPPGVQVAGIGMALLGSALTVWAVASNRSFYGVLRVAQEGGHAVCASGPYRHVRHPGYLGMILGDLATPLILTSAWALIPAMLTVGAILVRTALEDRALQAGLVGYQEYAHEVHYRLLPRVW
jgi:protein-S-isoprenylcysteine O-methyltransferase Ste14